MKTFKLNRLGSWRAMLLAGCLLLGLAPTAPAALYENLTVDDWQKVDFPGANSGTFSFTDGILHITSSTISGSSYTIIQLLNVPTSTELFGFDYWLTPNGDPNAQAFYRVGSADPVQFSGTSGRVYFNVAAGETVYVELIGDLVYGKKNPPQFDLRPVPEVGAVVAGILVILAAATMEWWRRKRTNPEIKNRA